VVSLLGNKIFHVRRCESVKTWILAIRKYQREKMERGEEEESNIGSFFLLYFYRFTHKVSGGEECGDEWGGLGNETACLHESLPFLPSSPSLWVPYSDSTTGAPASSLAVRVRNNSTPRTHICQALWKSIQTSIMSWANRGPTPPHAVFARSSHSSRPVFLKFTGPKKQRKKQTRKIRSHEVTRKERKEKKTISWGEEWEWEKQSTYCTAQWVLSGR